MLVLNRRIGERLVIEHAGVLVEVAVTGVKGNQVSLGIIAPKHIPVHREEVYRRLKQEGATRYQGNEQAANTRNQSESA